MLLYGVFNIVMGFLAYLNKGSIVSLAAAGIAGLLVIGCAALTKTHPRIGFIAASVIGIVVAMRFAGKAFGGEIYPAMIIFVVSILFVVILVGAHFAAVAKRKRGSAASS